MTEPVDPGAIEDLLLVLGVTSAAALTIEASRLASSGAAFKVYRHDDRRGAIFVSQPVAYALLRGGALIT